jgi:alpha-ketoglutarate-dependent taurine dioxygenase
MPLRKPTEFDLDALVAALGPEIEVTNDQRNDEPEQRRLAISALKGVSDLAEQVRKVQAALTHDGFALTRFAGLEHLSGAAREAVCLAISSLLGTPSPIQSGRKLAVWDVKPRPDLPERYRAASYAFSSGEALMHTDSTFADRPERWFALWCVRPAKDGGASVLIDGRRVISALGRAPEGQAALHTLRTRDIPLWDGAGVRPIRVFGGPGQPCVRYRTDLVERGVQETGLTPDDSRVTAVAQLDRCLNDESLHYRYPLYAGDVLFVDNHRTLHAREDFTDADRHLLRIRLHETPLHEIGW